VHQLLAPSRARSFLHLARHGGWAALGCLALAGCSDPPPAREVTRPPPQPPVPIAAPRNVASPLAFDLVHTPAGAVLAWGTPSRNGGGLRALALDPLGTPRGTEVDVVRSGEARSGSVEEAPAQIEELTLAASGSRVGLAWVLGGRTPTGRGTFATREGEGLRPPWTLGRTVSLVPGSRATRGRVAISTREDGALVVMHRLEDARCSEAVVAETGAGDATCGRIARAELDALVAAMTPDPPMEVPSPCAALLPGAVTTAGTWFYGICHTGTGAPGMSPVTTVYAIRPSISYAAANETLPGCLPEALVPLAEGAAVVGACEGARRISILDATGREAAVIPAATTDVLCEGGRPVIVVTGEATPRRIPLLAAVSRIEAFLPERLAPRHSRAVWTGTSLLVAAPLESEVSLRRYECRDLGLTRTDLP